MTTHELAKKLLDGPDVMVTRGGMEGGQWEITEVANVAKLELNRYTKDEYWYGPHEYDMDGDVDAVYIW